MTSLEMIVELLHRLDFEKEELKTICRNSHNTPRYEDITKLVSLLHNERRFQQKLPLSLSKLHGQTSGD